ARAGHAASGQGAEARECADPRGEPRQGDGDHRKAVYALTSHAKDSRINHGSVVAVAPPQEEKLDLSLTPDQETFRATVRAWLSQNIPRDWKPMGTSEIPRKEQYELLRSWQR